MVKSFSEFLKEAEVNKPPTEVDKAKARQEKDTDRLKSRQDAELARAREADFRKKEQELKKKQQDQQRDADIKKAQTEEVLEFGTPETTAAYKKATPGQS